MIIEKLSSLTIKVTISNHDMKNYRLDFDSLSENSINTKQLIRHILREISRHLGINLFNESLYIEAFSYNEKKYILYISVTDARINECTDCSNVSEKSIIETADSKKLILFSKDFVKYYSEYCTDSSLYHRNDVFRLIIETVPEKSESVADCAFSHGLHSFHGNICAAETTEYYDCIIENSAAEKLAGQISL